MRNRNEIVESKESTKTAQNIEAERKNLETQLERSIQEGNMSYANYYEGRLNELDSKITSASENANETNDEKIGSKSMANMYREQAAKAAIELGKTSRTYRDLMVKAELEEMKD